MKKADLASKRHKQIMGELKAIVGLIRDIFHDINELNKKAVDPQRWQKSYAAEAAMDKDKLRAAAKRLLAWRRLGKKKNAAAMKVIDKFLDEDYTLGDSIFFAFKKHPELFNNHRS